MKQSVPKMVLGLVATLIALPGAAAELRADRRTGDTPTSVTFNKDVAPLLFRHCAECHRPNQVAPFSLLTYADARKHAKQVVSATSDRLMPPWKSVAGHGTFVGERRLSNEEIALLTRWVKEGAREGDARDLPSTPQFRDDWKLGTPDLIVRMPAAYEVPAEGQDVYRNFVFKLEVPPGKYIKAAEFQPSNRRVVHHAVLTSDATGEARAQQADPALGYAGSGKPPGRLFPGSLATWTPGRDPMPLGDGLSLPWKKGADFVLQLHLHPSGKPEQEQSRVGFYFTDTPPIRSMVDLLMIDKKIDIEPGDSAYRTRDELTLPIDMEALSIFPHMHLLGHDIKITAHPPEGSPVPLIWISDWDFNWQTSYQFQTPLKLVAGTRIVMEGIHDNSTNNVRNPYHPPLRTVWGEETTNEMSVAFLQFSPVNEADLPKLRPGLKGRFVSTTRAPRSNPPTAPAPDNPAGK